MSAAHLKGTPINYEGKQGCTGKHAYVSRSEARKMARMRNLNTPPYPCPHCGNWHLTSTRKFRRSGKTEA